MMMVLILATHVLAFLAGAIVVGVLFVTESPLERLITCGRRWRHVRRGVTVVRLGRGTVQCNGQQLVDMSSVIIYYHEGDEALWVRPESEFEDGRFVPIG
jgi:hypothetical protein